MSERSISSDWTPIVLLKAFLQEEPLTSRSNSTGSKGELYRPYLRDKNGHYLNVNEPLAVATGKNVIQATAPQISL